MVVFRFFLLYSTEGRRGRWAEGRTEGSGVNEKRFECFRFFLLYYTRQVSNSKFKNIKI